MNAPIQHKAIENPVGVINSIIKPTQFIQPYEYGDPYRKKTGLWLVNLPCLQPTNIVKPELKTYNSKSSKKYTFSADYGSGNKGHGKRSSKTYQGIADAMAAQWGEWII